MKKNITKIIDLAIFAGKEGDSEIYDLFQTIDESIGSDLYSNNLRNFFDCWSDAIGHDYLPYIEKDIDAWVCAAQEIKDHYLFHSLLPPRELWRECAVKYT